MPESSKRRRPFTEAEIRKTACFCCGAPAEFQWNACADGNIWRPLCRACDVKINIAVLKILHPANWREKVQAYALSIEFNIPKRWLR